MGKMLSKLVALSFVLPLALCQVACEDIFKVENKFIKARGVSAQGRKFAELTGKSKLACECATKCQEMNGIDMYVYQEKVKKTGNANNKGRCMCLKANGKKIVMKARKEKKGVVSGFITQAGLDAYENRKQLD